MTKVESKRINQPIDLASFDNQWYRPGRPTIVCAAWFFLGLPLLRSSLIPSSSFRRWLLKIFGGKIGSGVILKPGVRVKYPWLLQVGENSWLGEDCWIDNLVLVAIGSNVCLSQGCYLCTGNHDWTDPKFGLITKQIEIEDGVWIGARATVLPGSIIKMNAIVTAAARFPECWPKTQFTAETRLLHGKVETLQALSRTTHAMKILCINQFFWPDLAPTGQLLTDLVRTLANQGHEVTIICGQGIYAATDHSRPLPSVKVKRIAGLPFSRGHIGRILGYASFFFQALCLALLADRPDVVVSMTTPPLISIVGSLVKRLKGARHYIWEMDLYPEIAVDLGFIRQDSVAARLIGFCADRQRRLADGIIALGECMKERLVARGLDPALIHIAHNWADGSIFYPRHHANLHSIVCIYAGNFGLGHDHDTIRAVLLQTHPSESIRFRFVGGGARYRDLQNHCKDFNYGHVEFKPYCTPAELAHDEFPTSNVGLVLQGAECSGSVVPSKVYSLLASGLPIIFVGPLTATPAQIISRFNCGWQIDPGDALKFTALLHRLTKHPEDVRAAGTRARQAFLNHFDSPIGVARITSILGLPEQQEQRPFAASA